MNNQTVVYSHEQPLYLSETASFFIILSSLSCLTLAIFFLICYIEKRQNTKRLAKRKKVYPNEII